MYPNTYLGAGNGLRPGQQPQQQPSPQYGGASPFGQPPQQQQQPSPFAPQPTGFGQAPLQSQYTGYPGLQPQATGMPLQAQATGMPQQMPGQLQQQYTGFPGQGLPQQTGFQTSAAPPMPAIPAQYQQQVQPPLPSLPQKTSSPFASTPSQGLAPPAAPMKPQPTGFQEMAASFQTAGGAAARASAAQSAKPHNRIPNIRLSFITAQDQTKFETLFTSAVGDGQTTMSGEKARDLLLRSRLDGDSLSHIWTLADTTRSGQLHFPEFALAMYLCNLKLTGKTLPTTLPDTVKNEVSSMVDIINFNIEDSGSNAGNPARQPTASPTIHHPQPQASNSQLLQATMTGYPGQQQQQQQQPAFLSQPTGLQPQQTGYPGMPQNPQPTGYAGPLPPMPPMPTGFNGGPNAMAAPLNAQPTGRPGQWGLVNTPSSGLPNIDILQARMMPQTGRDQGSFTTVGLQGNAQIPWAITKGEKTTYDAIFRAWDGMNKGYIAGSQAIEIFGQSGLEKPDLERIWTLADHGNKGRLNLDEFAVAMHLIYRKLNGYPVPARLPAELVPPSTRNFSESLDTLKNLVNQESDYRKNSGAALLPQKTGVSYLKNHSFRNQQGAAGANRKDGTVFKNNDEAVGYRSSARRRIGGGTDSPRPDSPSSVASNDDLTLDQLRKKVKEKQVLLDALDFKDEKNAEEDEILDRKDRREADELYRRIRRIQEDIDSHPNASQMQAGGSSDAERRTLKRQLQAYTDKIPALASQVRKTEKAIAEARLELFRIKDAKAHPSSEEPIVGTGPGGAVTESDRVKARAKAMMRQRTAALRGEKIESSDNGADAARRLEEESSKVRSEKENNERMVQDVEESVRAFAAGIEDNLKDTGDSSTSEHERRRWEDALGVEDEVRDFIFDLQRTSRSNRLRAQERRHETRGTASVDTYDGHSPSTSRMESPASSTRSPAPTAAAGGSSYSAYKTPEERAAYIKEQAAQRMQERLAAIGISRRGESAAQRAEREKSERAEKARAAEEETARRDAERQARLAEEQGIPPPVAAEAKKAAPPPPAVRKAAPAPAPAKVEEEVKEEPAADDDELATAESRLKQLEEQVRLSKLKKEEEKKKKKAAHAEAKEREAKMAARRAEIEAARKREEELRRQLEHMDDDDEDDDSSDDDDGPQQITPQASTPTVASSQVSNDREVRPAAAAAAAPPAAPAGASPGSPDDAKAESRNPYFRMMSQSSDSSAAAASAAAAPAPPSAPATVVTPPTNAAPASDASTNPFHRMTVNPIAAAAPMAPMPTGPISRKRADADDDGWGSDNDDDDDDESDDDRPGGKSAAELASRLFGSMAPPRPLSAVGDKGSSSSPAPVASPTVPPPVPAAEPAAPAATPMSPDSSSSSAYADAPTTAPPPPPPVPSADAPSVPPPPPPPPPPFGAPAGVPPPPPPPPPPGGAPGAPPPPPPGPPPPPTAAGSGAGGRVLPAGFLGEVMTGKALKKTVTIDKSGAATAGRVLD